MISVFTWLLSPIVWAMEVLLDVYARVLGSTGLAILLLSATFCLALLPIQRRGARLEQKIAARKQQVDKEIAAARKPGMTGEERFEITEQIYQKNGYHPIQAMLSGASFIAALPILISSVILFTTSTNVSGQSFLLVSDLGSPDRLLPFGINILPFLMTGITLTDAAIRYRGDNSSQFRVLLISVVLFLLVYTMPSALVLYWIGNGLTAMALARTFN